ncbi:prophage Lp2 protein 33 [Streptococcus pneumoniae]|nr:prophage Lp2 protein 33 [Streptococcus pneumoniae]
MKYRKKPVVVEAVQWNGNNHKEVIDFAENKIWFDALGNIWIATLEGDMVAKKGDYIIKGVQGGILSMQAGYFCRNIRKNGGIKC